MSNLAYNIIYPQPRKLTLGVILALTLFSLTVNAQNTVFRYNSSSGEEPTAQGTDIGAVQKAPGAAEGDVIKVSDGAAFNTQVTDPVSGFTVESATGNVVNVPVQAGYIFPQVPAAPVNAAFRNVSFTGAENYTSNFWSGNLYQDNIIGITIDGNVSFSNFKDSVFDYYQTDTSKQYYPYKFTCTNGSNLTFSGNTINGDGAGAAILQLSELNGNSSFMTFSDNEATVSGGAIKSLTNLTGENNKITFSNNKANGTDVGTGGYGGAIWNLEKLSGSGNTLEFTDNKAGTHGGAMEVLGDVSGSGNTLEFTSNTAECLGGAIGQLTYLSGSGNTLTFSSNTANGTGGDYYDGNGGGAIYYLDFLTGNNNTLTFSKNTANGTGSSDGGGAIYQLYNLSGSGNTLEFSENTATRHGGAIYTFGDFYDSTGGLSGNNNTLIFQNNKANGTSVNDGGGAIFELKKFSGSGNTLEFTGNTAANKGGAIGIVRGGISGENNTLTFTGNTAGTDGGAIYSYFSIEFSGNNTLTFTGNKAGRKGNDIYLKGYTSTLPANLTFNGGTYSFDGGIWLAEYNGQTGKTTISNGAKVTIAGRNDDSVNEYEFNYVALNANLTATVDDIEYLHGNFAVGENGLMTIKKGSDTATIKSSSDDGGVFDLRINKAENVETISISSGRIDIKGCIDASIELQNDATFSPGNSVGHVDIDGDFILNAGTTLLIEMDATGIDTMAATSFDLDNGTISFTLSDEIPGGATYDILTAKNGTAFDEDIITRMLNGQTLPEYYTLALAGPSNNIVRFSIDRNAVPEPSTWALLILGAAGLLYVRKRK